MSLKSMVSFVAVSVDETAGFTSVASCDIFETVVVANGFRLLYFVSSHFNRVVFSLSLSWFQDTGVI